MRYLNDILLNLDDVAYAFYEWRSTDNLISVKKIPVMNILEEDLFEILKYKIKLPMSFLDEYHKKTIIKGSQERATMILFANKKGNIVIEFNDEGKEIARSHLQIEDDLNAVELACTLKENKFEYQKIEKIKNNHELRIAQNEKRLIKTELKTLEAKDNIGKLSYLYFEWFSIFEENKTVMINNCLEELKKPYNSKMHEIASLIKLSYKERL